MILGIHEIHQPAVLLALAYTVLGGFATLTAVLFWTIGAWSADRFLKAKYLVSCILWHFRACLLFTISGLITFANWIGTDNYLMAYGNLLVAVLFGTFAWVLRGPLKKAKEDLGRERVRTGSS